MSGFTRRVCVFKMSRIGGAIRDTIATGNDAPRVSDRKRGRPVSGVVKCPGSEPRAFLFALVAAQMPSTVRTARTPTDLKPNLIRVKKRDDERAHRRGGGERVKEFQHLGTSERVVGRPRTGCVARVFYCECMHPQLVNAILTNICSIFICLIRRAMEPGCVTQKNGANSSAESAPKREWQSKNVDGREKCPQVSWPSHPTCQRDG